MGVGGGGEGGGGGGAREEGNKNPHRMWNQTILRPEVERSQIT